MIQAPWDTWEYEVPAGTTATGLADGVERATADLVAAAASLSGETIERPGTFDKWSARDVLAHCLAWSEICARVLSETAAGTLNVENYREIDVADEEEDELNERQVDELSDVPAAALIRRLQQAGDGAAAALRTLGDDPPAPLILMTVVDHFPEHAAEFRALEA